MGPIGVSLSSVTFYNQYAGGGAPLSNEINSFDQYNGHPAPGRNGGGGRYHYHMEPFWLTKNHGKNTLIGFLLDGFPIYGPVENGQELKSADLDDHLGHSHSTSDFPDGIYHYHLTPDAPYLNGIGYYGVQGLLVNKLFFKEIISLFLEEMKKLQRTLSLPGAIAVSIGGMLSGIFVLPGLAVGITGSSIWLAFLVAALCILPAVLSKSELATAMPKSGGTYVYIERAFGPLFGTVAGIGLWLSLLLKSAFSLVGLSAYLYVLIEVESDLTKIIALLALLVIVLLNVFGVKKVEKTQLVIVTISLISLIIIVLGFNTFDSKLTEPIFSDGSSGFITGVAFLYISYAGVTKIAAVAGEIKTPEKNLPRTMIISLFLITTIYVLVAIVLVGNVEQVCFQLI